MKCDRSKSKGEGLVRGDAVQYYLWGVCHIHVHVHEQPDSIIQLQCL
jgi:hypothetical protein